MEASHSNHDDDDSNPYIIKALLQPASGKPTASGKPAVTGEKYRNIRERKHSATDYAGIVMGRKNLQKVDRDMI